MGSVITILFGAWHFFVPALWKWYSYIPAEAAELVLAVKAINFFFSLSLLLFGVITLLILLLRRDDRTVLTVILGAQTLLWGSRVFFQIVLPQGSEIPAVRYGMLAVFILTFLLFSFSLAGVSRVIRH